MLPPRFHRSPPLPARALCANSIIVLSEAALVLVIEMLGTRRIDYEHEHENLTGS